MIRKVTHIAAAVVVFVALSGALLWLTGTFSMGGAGGHAAPPAGEAACADGCGHPDEKASAKDEHAGHDHAAAPAAAAPAEHAGHDHAAGEAHAPVNLSPEEIEKKRCEHNVRTIDCEECRYELGVVKVAASVTGALVRTVAVGEAADLVEKLRLTGEVQYDPTGLVEVLPPAAGKIVAVKVRLGQQVKAGDVLAVIHSGEFGEAKATYLEALAAADVAGQEKDRQAAIAQGLERLGAALAKGGTLAADAAGGPLGEWKSKLVGAAARLRQAAAVRDREKALVARQASSQAELDEAEREWQTAQADLSALTEEVQLNVKLDALKATGAARLAQAKLGAAEQRLHLFGLDDAALADLPRLRENGRFAQLEIRSPRAGAVTAHQATEGRFVEATQNLFTIADMSNLWVWCDLYERDLAALGARLAGGGTARAEVRVAAFPGEAFAGTVDHIASAVDESTRTIKVRVQVKNDRGLLKPGMFATVEVDLPAGRKATFVPRQAVLNDEGRHFAFQHWKDDLWLRRDVVLGRTQDDQVEIVSGLSPGAKIVSGGGFLLKSDVLRAKMGAGCAD